MPVVRFTDNETERQKGREAAVQVHGLRTPVPFGRGPDMHRTLDALPGQQADGRRAGRPDGEEPVDDQAQAPRSVRLLEATRP